MGFRSKNYENILWNHFHTIAFIDQKILIND